MKYTKKILIDGKTEVDFSKTEKVKAKFTQKKRNLKTKTVPFTFPSKKEEEEYIYICETIWGCVPIEVDWAIDTKPYKNYLNKINKPKMSKFEFICYKIWFFYLKVVKTKSNKAKLEKIIVMGGHKEGIIAFGKSLEEAGNIIINNFNHI